MIGPNTLIFFISSLSALIYSGQVALVVQKINEILHWKYGCNPINSVGMCNALVIILMSEALVSKFLGKVYLIYFRERIITLLFWPRQS